MSHWSISLAYGISAEEKVGAIQTEMNGRQ